MNRSSGLIPSTITRLLALSLVISLTALAYGEPSVTAPQDITQPQWVGRLITQQKNSTTATTPADYQPTAGGNTLTIPSSIS